MPLNGTDLITDIGEQKLVAAAGSNTAVQITHVAIGDGNGVRYAPAANQTALVRELARRPIESRTLVGTNSWRTKVVFNSATAAINVREIGFFDSDGDLIALWAGADVEVRQTGAIDYVLDHILNFSRVRDGLVVVLAPDDQIAQLEDDVADHEARIAANEGGLSAHDDRIDQLEADILSVGGSTFWVHPGNGSDDASGTAANPLRTISEACSRMVPGGQHIVNLLADYYWSTRDTIRASDLILQSDVGGPQRQITFAGEATNRPGSSPGLLQFQGGFQLAMNNLAIRLSPMAAAVLASEPSFIRTTAFPRVKFLNSAFTLLGNADQFVVNPVVPQDLYIENCTFPSNMGGRWIAGVSANASPSSQPHLRTNLSSL